MTRESSEFGLHLPATRTTASQAASTDGHAFDSDSSQDCSSVGRCFVCLPDLHCYFCPPQFAARAWISRHRRRGDISFSTGTSEYPLKIGETYRAD